jgi:hypothetical protein
MTMSNEKIEQHCTAQAGEGSRNTNCVDLRSDCGRPTEISPKPGCRVLVGLRPGRRTEFPRRVPVRLGMAALLAVLGAIAILNVRAARAEIRDIRDPFAMHGVSAWLAAHTPTGSLVFNTDWVEFPELFYYNQCNIYVTGLDPRYLSDSQPELWKLYDRITQGLEKHPGPIIRERFGTEYVVARNDSTDFLDAAKSSGDFDTVYSDAYASVLRVR